MGFVVLLKDKLDAISESLNWLTATATVVSLVRRRIPLIHLLS
jgi:hypothetical protein